MKNNRNIGRSPTSTIPVDETDIGRTTVPLLLNSSPIRIQEELYKMSGTDFIEGITLDLDLHNLKRDLCLSFNSLAKMTNLRFLQIIFFWRNKFNLHLPPTELRMPDSKLKKPWDGVQNLANLNIISLCGCRNLIEIPDLSNTEKLESVFLHECVSLHQLHHVHAKSLQRLLAYGCSSLKEFSVISEEITELNLGHTAICALLSSIWQKRKLTILSLDNCNNLVGINIVHLSSLERLYSTASVTTHLTDSSITIPYLPKSDLCGFIYCVFLTKGSTKYGGRVSCSIYQDGIKVGWVLKYYKNLISDHVLFCYHGIRKFGRIS
ncbi:Disease resistance protein RPS6 [Glycine soja]